MPKTGEITGAIGTLSTATTAKTGGECHGKLEIVEILNTYTKKSIDIHRKIPKTPVFGENRAKNGAFCGEKMRAFSRLHKNSGTYVLSKIHFQ